MSSIGTSLKSIDSMPAPSVNDGREVIQEIEKAKHSFQINELVKKSQNLEAKIFKQIFWAAIQKESVDTSTLFEILLSSKIADKACIQAFAKELYKKYPPIIKELKFKAFISSYQDSDKIDFVSFIVETFMEKNRFSQYSEFTQYTTKLINKRFTGDKSFLVPLALKCAEYIPECIAKIEVNARNKHSPSVIGLTKQQLVQFLNNAFASKKIMKPDNNSYLDYLLLYKDEFSQDELVNLLNKSLACCDRRVVFDLANTLLEDESFYGFIVASTSSLDNPYNILNLVKNRKFTESRFFPLLMEFFSKRDESDRDILVNGYLRYLTLHKNEFSQDELVEFLNKFIDFCYFGVVFEVAKSVLNDEFYYRFIVSSVSIKILQARGSEYLYALAYCLYEFSENEFLYRNEASQHELFQLLNKSLKFCDESAVLSAACSMLNNKFFYDFIESSISIRSDNMSDILGLVKNRKNIDSKFFSLMVAIFIKQPEETRKFLVANYLGNLELYKNKFSQNELLEILNISLNYCDLLSFLYVADSVLNDAYFYHFIISLASRSSDGLRYILRVLEHRKYTDSKFFSLMFELFSRSQDGAWEMYMHVKSGLEKKIEDHSLLTRALMNIALNTDCSFKEMSMNFPMIFEHYPKISSLLSCKSDMQAFFSSGYPTDTSPLRVLWQKVSEEVEPDRKLDLFQFCLLQEARFLWACELHPDSTSVFRKLHQQIANIHNIELKKWAAEAVLPSFLSEPIYMDWVKAAPEYKDHTLLPSLLAINIDPRVVGTTDYSVGTTDYSEWKQLYNNLSNRHLKNKDFLIYTLEFFRNFKNIKRSQVGNSRILRQMFCNEDNVSLRIRIITTLLQYGAVQSLTGEILSLPQLKNENKESCIKALNLDMDKLRGVNILDAIDSKLFNIRNPYVFPALGGLVNIGDSNRMSPEARNSLKEALGKFATSILLGKYKEQRYVTSPHLQKLLELDPKSKEIVHRWQQPNIPGKLLDYIPSGANQPAIVFNKRYQEMLRDRLLTHNHIPELHKRLPFVSQYLEGTLSIPIDKLEGLEGDILHACSFDNDQDGIDYLAELQKKCHEFAEFKQDLTDFRTALINAQKKQIYDGYTIHVTDEYPDLLLLALETSGCTAIGKGFNDHCALAFPMDGTHKAIVIKPPGKDLDSSEIYARAVIDLVWDSKKREIVGLLQPVYSKSADVQLSGAILKYAKEYFSNTIQVPLLALETIALEKYQSSGSATDSKLEFYGSNAPFTYNDSALGVNDGFSQVTSLRLLSRPASSPKANNLSIVELKDIDNGTALASVKSINAKNKWTEYDQAIIDKYFDVMGRIYFAKKEDAIAGYITQGYRPSKHSILTRHFYIPYIAVDPDFQGKDIATSMMKKVKELAENQGIKKIKLEYRGNNEKAVKFYESLPQKLDLKAKNKNIGTYINGDPKVKLTMYLG